MIELCSARARIAPRDNYGYPLIDMPPPPPGTKSQEHRRLQERTGQLGIEHDSLSLDDHPFDQAEHDQHSTDLAHHKDDLAAHRRRCADQPSTPIVPFSRILTATLFATTAYGCYGKLRHCPRHAHPRSVARTPVIEPT